MPNPLSDDWLIHVRPIFGDGAWPVVGSHNHCGGLVPCAGPVAADRRVCCAFWSRYDTSFGPERQG